MTVFQCEDNFEGIFCGVYDAWTSRLGHAQVRLELSDTGNLEMFCEYRKAERTEEKFQKVADAVLTKLGRRIYEQIYQASLSGDPEKADWIYRYLIYGFHVGPGIIDMLQNPAVSEVFRMSRNVGSEAHQLTGFVRFSRMGGKVLAASIGPRNDVLPLLAAHFADRFSGEHWMIYDETRQKAAIHRAGYPWVMAEFEKERWEQMKETREDERYEELWKTFHRSISIAERENSRCQKGHLPLRYRPYMTEFANERRKQR